MAADRQNRPAAEGGESTIRNILLNAFLLFVSLAFSLSVAELMMRFLRSAPPFAVKERTLPHVTAKDSTLRWRFPPNYRGERNSLGLYNEEVGEKPKDVFRVLFLGDSLVFTGKTSSGKQYTEVVEERLNSRLANGKQLEIINAGVPGYTTYQELEFLKLYGLDMKPDLVVLGFVFNDVHYKYLHKVTSREMLDAEPSAKLNHFDTSFFPASLLKHSYLAHEIAFAAEKVACRLKLRKCYIFNFRDDFYLAWKEHGWRNSERLIGDMKDLLARNNIAFAMVAFPVIEQMNAQYLRSDPAYLLYPQSRIKGIAERYGIPFFDLTPGLARNGGESLFSDYLHMNGKGNDAVAAQLEAWLPRVLPPVIGADLRR